MFFPGLQIFKGGVFMPIYKMSGKKDGLQKYRVRVNYTDDSGKARQIDRVAYGAQAAKELERQLAADLRTETSGKMTLRELYDRYMVSKKSEVRETTLDKARQQLTKYVLPSLGDRKLDKLTPAVLQKWKDDISDIKLEKGTGLSTKYKKNIYAAFVAMLNYGVKMEYLEKNPLTPLGSFKDVSELKKEIRYYTSDEFLRYIKVARAMAEESEVKTGSVHEWHYYVFFMIAFYAGMRKGEIFALKWSDLYDDTLHVTRSIAQKLKGEDRETPPKNKSSVRNIQCPQPLMVALTEHKERCSKIEGFSDNWRICGGERCIRDTTVDHHNRKYAAAAGLKQIRIHDFRHSHASLLVNNGINIKEVSRRLGHSNVGITWNTYSHLYPREEERAIKILNEIV